MLASRLDAVFKVMAYMAVWLFGSVLAGAFIYVPMIEPLGIEAPTLSLPYVTLEGVTFFIAVMAASLFGLKLMDRRPWTSVGLRVYPKAFSEISVGIGLGSVLVLVLWIVDAVWHALGEGTPIELPQINLPVEQIPIVLIFMAFVAFNEELLVRGFPLQKLIRTFGVFPGVIATSVMFGLFHLTGDAWNSAVVALDTAFAGALFAMCYLKTKALWMSMGVHFANNVVIFLIDAPDLVTINFIPPEASQDVFFSWWWMNFPVYVVTLILISRWRYRPDAAMQSQYDAYVSPKLVTESAQTFEEIEVPRSDLDQ